MAKPTYISKSQFVGQLNIDFGNYEDFNNFAYDIEEMYLYKLLGFQNRKIMAGILIDPALTVYNNIMNGIAVGYGDEDDKQGLYYTKRLKGGTEMLKNFFFYHYITEHQDARTVAGDPQQAYIQAVNGTKARYNLRVVQAYNRGVDLFNEIIAYITWYIDENPTSELFENWEYEELEKINTFGI